MYKDGFFEREHKKAKRVLAGVIALVLVFSFLLANIAYAAAPDVSGSRLDFETGDRIINQPTERQHEILRELYSVRVNFGLLGFEGEYALHDDNRPMDVIVILQHSPAGVLIKEAEAEGNFLSRHIAEQIIENEHEMFMHELRNLLGANHGASSITPFGNSYSVNQKFIKALNGIALTVPSNMVSYIAEFNMVWAIIPDESVYIPELPPVSIPGDPFGMSQGRARMNANALHNIGITGEGVVIAVIDSGIDYRHPAFEGTFPTIAYMQQRNPAITNEHGINIGGTYYFIGRDFIHLWPGSGGSDFRGNPTTLPPGIPGNDPMEFSPIHFPIRGSHLVDNAGIVPSWTSHGTHVAGTIVGQPIPVEFDIETNEPVWDMSRAIMGVAPGARAFHYRALFGSTPTSVVLAAMEMTYHDRPDIVSMSLSGGLANPLAIQNIAINNLMLQNPYKVFVVSAGNSGPSFYTSGNPSGATMAITVSNLTEQEVLVGANLTSGTNVNTTVFSVIGNPSAEWVVRGDGSITNTFPRLAGSDGEFRIFALPNFGSSGATGTEDIDIGSGFGMGLAESFVELFLYHGPQALDGAFILIRRPANDNTALENAPLIAFDPAIIGAPPGIFNVLGGVIVIDGTAPITQPRNIFTLPNLVPTLMIDNESGRRLFENIMASDTYYATFRLSGDLVPQIVASSSSRGPVFGSFEIKPDVGAHGTDVFSTVPTWAVGGPGANNPNWANIPWSEAYDFRTGSSMSTPHVAGGVALMIQYSRQNGAQWDSQEIKSRIMNTAVNLDYPGNNYGVFDGARQMDVLAAISTDTVVSVNFPGVATVLGLPLELQHFETVRTGSFSFGGFNRQTGTRPMYGEMMATIFNNSDHARTFTINHRHITTGRNSLSGGRLSHPARVTVPANGSANFGVAIGVPPGTDIGHYEGFVIVSYNGASVAYLPFAAVAINQLPVVQDIVTYRPVISTGAYAQNNTSSELVVGFTANAGFSTNLHLVRAVQGINSQNWDSPAFAHALLGTVGNSRFFSAAMGRIQPGTSMRGVIFDGSYTPTEGGMPVTLYEEGDFYIVMEVWRQGPNLNNAWAWEKNVLIPFSVDNTPPGFASLSVNGADIDLGTAASVIHVCFGEHPADSMSNDLVISGNVYDAWLTQAISRGLRFDVWHGSSGVFGPQPSIPNNLALWVLAGENQHGNRPVRAELEHNGNFTVTLPYALNEDVTDISLWLIDGYAPVPSINQAPFGSNPWNALGQVRATPGASVHFEMPGGIVWVSASYEMFLRRDTIYSWESLQIPMEAFSWYDWSGLNVTELNIRVTNENGGGPTPDRVFGLEAFNNGIIDNQSLADAGIIRIWLQLDGENAPIPYGGLTVQAILPDGSSAMEFVRPNRIWDNPDYVNLVDVDFIGQWERIYFTATAFEQTVELTLLNPMPAHVPVFDLEVFNNGTINNQSLAESGLIRIWLQLDGIGALVPYSELSVQATLPDGTDAMEFVRPNRIWDNPGYVNLIDVDFWGYWERIYLTVAAFGQTIELVLINPQPPHLPVFGLEVFNNGTINNQSLAESGIIRIWLQLDGTAAPVPTRN